MRNVAADNTRRRRSRLSSSALSIASAMIVCSWEITVASITLASLLLLPWSSRPRPPHDQSDFKGHGGHTLHRRARLGLDALHFFPATAARVEIAPTARLSALRHCNFTAAIRVRAAVAFALLKCHSFHLLPFFSVSAR